MSSLTECHAHNCNHVLRKGKKNEIDFVPEREGDNKISEFKRMDALTRYKKEANFGRKKILIIFGKLLS